MPHKAELERTKQELAQALAEIDKIGKCATDIVSRDLLPIFLHYLKLILFLYTLRSGVKSSNSRRYISSELVEYFQIQQQKLLLA